MVFEGADVVGKTEQVNLLLGRFAAEGIPVMGISFPRYDTPAGLALGRHLRGEISVVENDGTLDLPHVASEDALFFEALNCLDKMAAAADIVKWLSEGTSVISSRWWQSAVIYGGDTGIPLEYLWRVYSRMPQADVNFLLVASAETCLARRGIDRDRYERDLSKQERVREAYHTMWTSSYGAGEGWSRILDGEEPAEKVHERVWDCLKGHSKMKRLLARARHGRLSPEKRLEKVRAIITKSGNKLCMSKEDAQEIVDFLFAISETTT